MSSDPAIDAEHATDLPSTMTQVHPPLDTSSDILISAQNVSKCYEIYAKPIDRLKQTLWRGRRQFYTQFWALRNISFEVRRGQAVAIIGRNGSGKSTLLQIIAGTLRPTEGQVLVQGRVAALLELGSGFNMEFTGRENVFLNGAILGLSQNEIRERFDAIASFADIGDFIDLPVKTYSTGMLVRLAFAVQAQLEPDVLIVDEALAVGDEKFQRKCYTRLDQLREKGTAILLVTHSMATVEKYCRQAILLEKGTIHGFRDSKSIIDQYHALLYADEQAYLRMANQQIAATQAHPEPEAPPPSAPAPAVEEPPAEPEGSKTIQRSGSMDVSTQRAQIQRVWLKNRLDEATELLETGEEVEVGFLLKVFDDISVLQVGLRIRTIEGVEVYGTSSSYLDKSLCDVRAGSCCRVRFRFPMNLCAGVYFISLAAAEAVGRNDMRYLDKRTDILMFKVREHPITGTGIAHLHADVACDLISEDESAVTGGLAVMRPQPELMSQ